LSKSAICFFIFSNIHSATDDFNSLPFLKAKVMKFYIIPGFLASVIVLVYLMYKIRQAGKKKSISSRYESLIYLISKLDKKMVVWNKSDDAIAFTYSDPNYRSTILLTQFPGIISVEVFARGPQKTRQRHEWFFSDNKDQYSLFTQIIKDIRNDPNKTALNPRLLRAIYKKHVNKDIWIGFPELFWQKDKAVVLFCVAWEATKIMNEFKVATYEERAEILFFNCYIALQSASCAGLRKDELEQGIIELLIFFINKHEMNKSISDLQAFIDDRIELYTAETELIRQQANYNCNVLYYHFYYAPLSMQSKFIKSETNIHLYQLIVSMVAEIDERIILFTGNQHTIN
jgi:hypothetical protein